MNKGTGLLLLAGIVVAGAAAIYMLDFKRPAWKSISVKIQKSSEIQKHKPMQDFTITKALARTESSFELQPDKRFLVAVSITALFPNAPGALSSAAFQDGQWQISTGKGVIGDLPQYPDFTDAMRLLRTVAEQRRGISTQTCNLESLSEVAKQSAAFDDNSLLAALNNLNQEFHGEPLPGADLWLGARAMTRLTFLDVDTTYTTDELSAKAMALLALAQVACGKTMPMEESLLAAHMGYSGAAARYIQQLPVSDPWRLYFTKNVQQLAKLALQNPTSSEAGYFWLRRLGDLDLKQQWRLWFNQRYGSQLHAVYALATVLPFLGCDCTSDYIEQLPQQLLPAMQGSYSATLDQDDLTKAPVQVIKDFDAATAHLRATYKGPYLTADDALAYYRGYLYTGLYGWAVYLLDDLDSIEDAEQYRDLLKTAPGGLGKELYGWMNVKLAFKGQGLPLNTLLRDMQSSKLLHPYVYLDDMEIASARTNWSSPQARQALKDLDTLLDTRPEFRMHYGDDLKANLYLPEYEAADRSLAAQENPATPNFRLWQDYFDANYSDLLRIAKDTNLDRDSRLTALLYLQDTKNLEKQVRDAYQEIVLSNPGYGYACKQYINYLAHIKDYADMERSARYCLKTVATGDTGFDSQIAAVQLTDAQLYRGKKDVAWETISEIIFEPRHNGERPGPYRRDVANYYAPVLAEGVKVALARGDYGTAEFLAKTLTGRYPDDIKDHAPLLRVMWIEGRYQDAEQYLLNWNVPLSYLNWVTIIGKTFSEVFAHEPKDARAAFLALAHGKGEYQNTSGIGSGPLVFIANAVAYYGNPSLAFELKQLIALPETPDMFPDQLSDYEFLKSAKGETVAIRWLMRHTTVPTPQDLDRRIGLFYTENDMELLWSPIANPDKAGDPDMLWLYRAAAYVQHYPITTSELAQLREHFAKAGDSWHEYLGKYLMGQVSDEEIMNRELDQRKFSEALYIVALHLLAEHNYRQAEELLSLSLDRPTTSMWGFFSRNLLGYWENLQSLPVLEKQGVLFNSSARGSLYSQ